MFDIVKNAFRQLWGHLGTCSPAQATRKQLEAPIYRVKPPAPPPPTPHKVPATILLDFLTSSWLEGMSENLLQLKARKLTGRCSSNAL